MRPRPQSSPEHISHSGSRRCYHGKRDLIVMFDSLSNEKPETRDIQLGGGASPCLNEWKDITPWLHGQSMLQVMKLYVWLSVWSKACGARPLTYSEHWSIYSPSLLGKSARSTVIGYLTQGCAILGYFIYVQYSILGYGDSFLEVTPNQVAHVVSLAPEWFSSTSIPPQLYTQRW